MRRQAAVSDPRTKEGTTTMPLLQALRPTLPILIGASLMLSLSMGLRQSLGIFLQPLTHDVGISVSDFTLAIAVQNLAWGFLQPLAGALTVRFGFRTIMMAGAVFYIAGLSLMAGAQGFLSIMLGAGVLIGMSLACTAAAIAMSVATRAVPATVRSTVLGIVSAAGSLGALLSAPIGQMLNEGYGWRIGVIGFVVLSLAMLPAAWFAGKVDKVPLPPKTTDDIGDTSAAAATRIAFGNASFVVMTLAYFVCGMRLPHHAPAVISGDLRSGSDAECADARHDRRLQRHRQPVLRVGRTALEQACLAGSDLHFPIAGARLVLHAAGHAGHHAFVWRDHGISLDGRRAAGRGRRRRPVRPEMAGDDPGARLHEPPARQLPRRLRGRASLRCARLLHHGLADRRSPGAG